MTRCNKATAAALIASVAAVWPFEGEVQGALQTVLTTRLVWLVPNVVPGDAGRPV